MMASTTKDDLLNLGTTKKTAGTVIGVEVIDRNKI